jgi:prevent-host-death family protein
MIQVDIHEAKAHFSKLIERVTRGEEFIIVRAGKPVARLTTIEPFERDRRFGVMKGKATVDERFFDPLPQDESAAWE